MPFELHINPDHLREVFEYIKELLDEVTLHVGSNAVTIDECDKNNIGRVNIAMNKKMFTKYVVPAKKLSLRIAPKRMAQILQTVSTSNVVITRRDDLLLLSYSEGGMEGSVEVRLLGGVDGTIPVMPDSDNASEAVMTSHEWETILTNFKMFADDLTLSFGKKGNLDLLAFHCEKPGFSQLEQSFVTTPLNAQNPIQIKTKRPYDAMFNLVHLTNYRGQKLAKKVKIQTGEELPLTVTFDFDKTTGRDSGHIQYVLAPKQAND